MIVHTKVTVLHSLPSRPDNVLPYLLSLSLINSENNPQETTGPFTTLFQWNLIDFAYPSLEEHHKAIILEEFVPKNNAPLARCERVPTSLNRTVSGDTFRTLSPLDKPRYVKRSKTIRAPGRLSTSKTDENIEKIGKLIRENRHLSIRGLAEIAGTDKECVRQILHEPFNMRKVYAKKMPKLLTPEHMESRMNICADILNNIDIDPGLLETVTLKGTRFESMEAVKAKATDVLK
ncbi:hypothetical protein NQ318_021813 [Aromia moschata]|uniref:Uncharacterized protein n=1 Tax=Aromia moschata TaxID=1265417 RepID=A0AAV8Z8M2_9CUCU|nr:hypothetical protein NQ318_021813 [Aromia moschata]